MFRVRVHMIISSEHLAKPTSFRMDVFQQQRDVIKAYEHVQEAVENQLGRVEPLSMSAEVIEV